MRRWKEAGMEDLLGCRGAGWGEMGGGGSRWRCGTGGRGLVEGGGREGWEWGALGGWGTLGAGLRWVWGWRGTLAVGSGVHWGDTLVMGAGVHWVWGHTHGCQGAGGVH